MSKIFPLVLFFLAAAALPALGEPPADLEACLKLSSQIAKDAGAKIKGEADYPKYHLKMMDLNSACGLKDFVGAERIANEMRADYKLDR